VPDAPGYDVRFQGPPRRALSQRLSEAVAAAVVEFCAGPLTQNPHRVAKPLFGPFAGCHGARRGTYRIIYRIDDDARVVTVLDVAPRATAYRPR
jgi:mRNA-degrading endonuclease RelE of RelBE toxin-antitoxin system